MIADEKNTWPEEWYIDVGEHLANDIADDDGMPPPYIQVEGITAQRMLFSWAELRALRQELRGWVSYTNYGPPPVHFRSSVEWYLPKHFDGFDED